jgi:hypothetical protein
MHFHYICKFFRGVDDFFILVVLVGLIPPTSSEHDVPAEIKRAAWIKSAVELHVRMLADEADGMVDAP